MKEEGSYLKFNITDKLQDILRLTVPLCNPVSPQAGLATPLQATILGKCAHRVREDDCSK